jgi:ABC-type nitrate/sulfonate/bicarbonate transport system substrate-binding protein
MKSLTLAASQTGAVGLVTRVMLDQEFDAANDLKVEPKYQPIPQAEKSLVNKQVDAAPLPPITAGRLNLRGNDLRGLRPFHKIHESAIVHADGPSDLEGLQGLKLGSLSRASGLYTVFSLLVRMNDYSLDQYDIRTASPSALYGLMLKEDLEATLHFDPFAARLLVREDFEEVFYYSDMWEEMTGNPIPVAEVGVWQETIDANPGALKSLSQALDDAGDHIQNNPDQVFSNYSDALGAENDTQLSKIQERMKGIYPSEFSTNMRGGSEQLIQKASEFGEYSEIDEGSEPAIDEIFIDPTSL